jgi:hypothetical protein
MFNTEKPLSMVSERSLKNECGKTIDARKLFVSNCLGKIITTGQILLLNYQGFQNNQVNLYEFFLIGM